MIFQAYLEFMQVSVLCKTGFGSYNFVKTKKLHEGAIKENTPLLLDVKIVGIRQVKLKNMNRNY